MAVTESPTSQSNRDTDAAQRLVAIVEFSNDAIVSKDLNGIIQTWNQGAERIFGYSAEEAIGKSILLVIPPELHDQEPSILSRIAKGELIERFETIRQRKDGSRFHVSLTVSPIRDQTGKIIGASKIGRDITDLRKGQEQQELLLREMNHRVKNLFAVASGVVALSARSAETPKELAKSVQSRLAALSRAHELILRRSGDASGKVELKELINLILAPYDHGDQRILISGPTVTCGDSIATSLALLLHEFATNSVKYGALSGQSGRITISWSLELQNVLLIWTEETLVQPSKEAKPGFGSTLAEATARNMSTEVSRTWNDNGLSISLRIPLDRMAA